MSGRRKLRRVLPGSDANGACIVCYGPTDTAVAFEGDREWLAAGLVAMGVPLRDAELTVAVFGPAVDSEGRATATFRVCRSCVSASGLSWVVPALTMPGQPVPVVRQPRGEATAS